ncbi:MAG: type II toxin-antitoxin system RelE/ParE family toxin [Candidatus Aminicenantes bacterium]|nr:type II toxin-antitoxin system RelE/ParE family toxin [Candidatus Aminicenantes bacterium]
MYEILLLPGARKDLDKLETRIFNRIIGEIRLLSENPRPFGGLKLTKEEGYRIRAGDFRILYRIDDAAKKVFIYRVKNRRDAYRA